MDRENRCPKCGAPLSGDSPEGLCPGCLLKAVAATPEKAEVTLAAAKIEGPGTTIGRYELLDLLGEGGMGLVYLAEQKEPVRRKVALKIIKPGMDTRQVVARFEAERQALALLDHPNIAHVFDAGCTETGRPYFVMEHVKGLPITSYCDQNKLTIEQRLRLFEHVCEAVHHAHQKGIIHRDLKPSNILVSVHGDRATPKIIDFGIAKAITSPLTDKTFVTYQGQLLGTPEYMSPEQVDLATQDIDTRSDIYSLGIVLYELLAGVLPFESESFAKAGLAEIQQTIREQEPTSPSIRLTNLGEKGHAIAASRGTQVVPLARRLHRELEWIPLKAMRKDRCRRYKSASEMADDIRNYLNGNPLLAGPETTIYRVQKFVRRHAGAVTTVALVVVVIVLGLVVSSAMYFRAEKALQRESVARYGAERARVQAEDARTQAEQAEQATKQKAEELRRTLYVNSIQLANAEYREGNIRRVRALLNACPNDLRAWEWDYLWHMSDNSLMTLQCRGAVSSIAISPDGGLIASDGNGDKDSTITLRDAATGTELMTLQGHKEAICSLAFSPDGKHIISASRDKTAKVWDATDGREIMTLSGHRHYVYSALYSPDGKRIVSSSHDGTIKVWDSANGDELMTVNAYKEAANSARYTPDGLRIIAAGGWDGNIKVWDAATGAEINAFQHGGGGVWTLALNPDGTRVLSGGEDGTVKVWDATDGKELLTLRGHREEVCSVAFSPDGKRIVSGSDDNTIKIWDATTGAEKAVLRGHESGVYDIVFSPNGKHIISGGGDNTVKIWDGASEGEGTTVNTRYAVEDLAFSTDGKRLITAGDDTVTIWDVETCAELTTVHGYSLGYGTINSDGNRIMCWRRGRRAGKPAIDIWDMMTRAKIMTLRGHENPIGRVSFSQDGKYIVTESSDNTIKVWDGSTGAELMTLQGLKERLGCVAFSPDGKRIVAGGRNGIMKVWDMAAGTELTTIQHGDGKVHPSQGTWSVAFSPDGKHIVSGGSNDKVKIWDAVTGAEVVTLSTGETGVLSVAFAADGRRVIGCGRLEPVVRVWDAETGTEVITLRLPGVPYGPASVSPDGKTLAVAYGSTSYSNTVALFVSAAPAGGYEARQTARAARRTVDELREKYGSYREVTNALRNGKTVDEPIRKIALQIANARKGEDAFKLYKESREALSSQRGDPNTYRAALEKVERANRLEPNNLGILAVLYLAQRHVGAYQEAVKTCTQASALDPNNPPVLARLAWVQCHVGAYDDALKTLSKADSLDPNTPGILSMLGMVQYRKGAYEDALKTLTAVKRPLASTLAFMTMSLHQLGRGEEARATLEQLRSLVKDERFAGDDESKALLAEAEGVVLGQGR